MQSTKNEQPASESTALAGRFAVVVGGSGGIGRAVSVELARRGATVLAHGRHASAKALEMPSGDAAGAAGGMSQGGADDMPEDGASSRHLTFDREFDTPHEFLSALDERLRALGAEPDLLICSFGPFLERPLADTSAADWERLAMANLALPGALASHFLPGMLRRGFGRFLFFGGTRTDSIRGFRQTAAYAAAKTGLGVLVKSIALEGASRNVAAALVCPGPTETEYQDASTRARHAGLTPRGNLASASLVARAAVDLIDADPCLASGAIVALDGGFAP